MADKDYDYALVPHHLKGLLDMESDPTIAECWCSLKPDEFVKE